MMKGIIKISILLASVALVKCNLNQAENPISVISKNYKPIIYSLNVKDSVVFGRLSTKVTCLASDLDNDNLKFSWISKTGSFEGSGPVVKWTAPNSFGFHTIICNVSDGKGGEAKDSVKIFVDLSPNLAPIIRGLYAVKDTINSLESTIIVCDAEDIDGDKLSFDWQLVGRGELISTFGNVATFKATSSGIQRIYCLVSDPTHTVSSYKIIYVR